MKFHPIPLIAISLLVCFFSQAQVGKDPAGDGLRYRLQLRNGSFIPQKNITTDQVNAINKRIVPAGGKSFTIIQFETIPTAAERVQLEQAGIELLDYIPGNAYT